MLFNEFIMGIINANDPKTLLYQACGTENFPLKNH